MGGVDKVGGLLALPILLFCVVATAGSLMPAAAQTIQVSSANPPAAEQGTVNLNVSIKGKGFKNGAVATFLVTGNEIDSGGVTVNTTTFVSPSQLVANIDVAEGATISKFDVKVRNSDGRTGKGTELFSVVAKGELGAKKAGGGDSSLALVATFRDARDPDTNQITDEITSDNGSPYKHGVDGQVTLGKADVGRFRLDLGTFNSNLRQINIDLSACGAPCDYMDGPLVGFLQSGSEFIPAQWDENGNIIGWTTSGDIALNLRTMKIADGVRYAHVYANLASDGRAGRRFNFSRPEHIHEAWRCNDMRAEPAKVVCTAEDGNGTCVGWEVSGRKGCFRKSEGKTWTTEFVEGVEFQVTLVPAP